MFSINISLNNMLDNSGRFSAPYFIPVISIYIFILQSLERNKTKKHKFGKKKA